MIILNVAKELIEVGDWASIESRPGFRKDLDPDEHSLETIIGRYQFKDRIRCGLSNCRTPHERGYIVVTKSGLETNIGKDCGSKYFGVDFETLSRQFDRDITEKKNRDALNAFLARIGELKERVRNLRGGERGADWVHKKIQPLLGVAVGVPSPVTRALTNLTKDGASLFSVAREASAEETAQEEARLGTTLPRPYYIEEPIAEIQGVEALEEQNDLRKILVLQLEQELQRLEGEHVDAMSYEQLDRWARWVGTVEAILDRASRAVASGRRLLQSENLAPLRRLLTDQREVDEFRAYLKTLD